MKILVLIKQTLDYRVRPLIDRAGKRLDFANLKQATNPFCAIALEQGLQLAEQNQGSVTVVSLCPEQQQEHLRHALALGADRAIQMIHPEPEDLTDNHKAQLISQLIKSEKPDLILMGKQAIDTDSGQLPAMLSALHKMPLVSCAQQLTILDDERLKICRETRSGLVELTINKPAIVSCDLRLCEPRIANMAQIIKAKRKTIERHLTQPQSQPGQISSIQTLSLKTLKHTRELTMLSNFDQALELIKPLRTKLFSTKEGEL